MAVSYKEKEAFESGVKIGIFLSCLFVFIYNDINFCLNTGCILMVFYCTLLGVKTLVNESIKIFTQGENE